MGRATALTFAGEGALVVGCDVAGRARRRDGSSWSRRPAARWRRSSRCLVRDTADCARLVELAVSAFGPNRRAVQPRGQVALRLDRERHRRKSGTPPAATRSI